MAEFKPGKWRFESGQEVVVIHVHHFITWIDSIGSVTRESRILFSGRKPCYVSAAVIGDESAEMVIDGLKQKLAETEERYQIVSKHLRNADQTYLQSEARRRSAEKDRDIYRERHCKADGEAREYRRKWGEAVEETRRLQQEVDDSRGARDNWKCSAEQMKHDRDKKARQVDRLQQEIATLKDEVEKRTYQIVELTGKVDDAEALLEVRSVDADGIQWYRFDSVTVAVRDGKEPIAQKASSGMWWAALGKSVSVNYSTRKEAEAWCRKQLVPAEEWRPATVEDVTGKPECRVRVSDKCEWNGRTLLAHDDRASGGPWVTLDQNGHTRTWPICEVRK